MHTATAQSHDRPHWHHPAGHRAPAAAEASAAAKPKLYNPRHPERTLLYQTISVDAGVCIEAHDRAALERLLRYCARSPFAMNRLRKERTALVYRCAKQHSEPATNKRGAKVDELTLTPLELIDRIAALVPPPRTHRHRYFGVLAPNSPLRAAVVAMALAAPAHVLPAQPAQAGTGEGVPGVMPQGNAVQSTPEPVAQPKQSKAHYLWAFAASLRSSQ